MAKTSKPSLKTQAVKSVFWVSLSSVVSKIAMLVSMLVLVRLLSKSDFGVYGIVITLATILLTAVSLGFDAWYVKAKDRENYRYALFVKTSIFSILIIAFGLFIFAGQISVFYKEPLLKKLVQILAVYFLLGGMVQLFYQYLAKRLEFKKTSSATIWRQIIQAIVSVGLAIYFKNVWPLFIGFITGGVLEFVILFSRVRRDFFAALANWGKVSVWEGLKKYGSFVFSVSGGRMINTAARLLPPLILGKTLGFTATGVFVAMNNLIAQPLDLIIGSISTISLPVLSKVSAKNLSDVSLKLSRILLVLSAPLFIYLWIFAEELIGFFLGTRWVDGANVLRYLMIAAFLNVVVSPISQNFIIRDKPQWLFWWNTIFLIGNILSLLIGSRFGLETAVLIFALFNTLMRLILQILMSCLLAVPKTYFLKIYWDYIWLWLPLTAIGLIIKFLPHNIWLVLGYMVVGLVIYFLLFSKWDKKNYLELKEIFSLLFIKKLKTKGNLKNDF